MEEARRKEADEEQKRQKRKEELERRKAEEERKQAEEMQREVYTRTYNHQASGGTLAHNYLHSIAFVSRSSDIWVCYSLHTFSIPWQIC